MSLKTVFENVFFSILVDMPVKTVLPERTVPFVCRTGFKVSALYSFHVLLIASNHRVLFRVTGLVKYRGWSDEFG